MKITFFGAKKYDEQFFEQENTHYQHELIFLDAHLSSVTAPLANGSDAICAFVNDELDQGCLKALNEQGIRFVALRCAGFNNVDLKTAEALGITVVRVPDYSPHGVAEHAVALVLNLNRKLYKAYNRVRENNFLLDGLLGFNLKGKTVGVIGTGKIGSVFCQIMLGFGCRVIAYDPKFDENCQIDAVQQVEFETLLKESDIISLHCPLTPQTEHIIDHKALGSMKTGVMLINTSRGALVDTQAVIKHLKTGKIGYLGLDVYEEEGDLFFEDVSNRILEDDIFARLLTFPNVLITGHQAFFTREALTKIAETTLKNFSELEKTGRCSNSLTFADITPKTD